MFFSFLFCKQCPVADDVSMEMLGKATQGYSGADITEIYTLHIVGSVRCV